MLQLFKNFVKDDEGQDLVEYALLVALIAIVVAAAFPPLTDAITDVFEQAGDELENAG
ncbi:MAG: Flp family type IVb pilin [Gemmatimonadota bacterium]